MLPVSTPQVHTPQLPSENTALHRCRSMRNEACGINFQCSMAETCRVRQLRAQQQENASETSCHVTASTTPTPDALHMNVHRELSHFRCYIKRELARHRKLSSTASKITTPTRTCMTAHNIALHTPNHTQCHRTIVCYPESRIY